MIWLLYKKVVKAMVLSTAAALVGKQADRSRQQRLLSQLDRIIRGLKQAHSLHPAWLTQQYGSLDAYLKQHLSADDWTYLLQVRQAEVIAELTSELPVPA